MASPFTDALTSTLDKEGTGIDELIPGIISSMGIQQKTLDTYNQRKGLPQEDVKSIQPEKVKQIYKEVFYQEPGYDKLPPEILPDVFDFGVHSGTPAATRALQVLVGTKVDGINGPKTQEAVRKYIEENGIKAFNEKYTNIRRAYVEKVIASHKDTLEKYRKGLVNRVESMRKTNGKNP